MDRIRPQQGAPESPRIRGLPVLRPGPVGSGQQQATPGGRAGRFLFASGDCNPNCNPTADNGLIRADTRERRRGANLLLSWTSATRADTRCHEPGGTLNLKVAGSIPARPITSTAARYGRMPIDRKPQRTRSVGRSVISIQRAGSAAGVRGAPGTGAFPSRSPSRRASLPAGRACRTSVMMIARATTLA